MDISVSHIDPKENSNKKILVRVDYDNTTADGLGQSASLSIWITNRDAPLSEIKQDALRAAFDFLRAAVAAHSVQSHP